MSGFDAGAAYRARMDDAVGDDGPRLRAQVRDWTLQLIGPDPTPERLRALGGISEAVRSVIGPAPAAEANDLGFATSRQWWRWQHLQEQVGELRADVQRVLARSVRSPEEHRTTTTSEGS